ncbi:MAG TPA: DUF4286 family protein [Chitinophagales bacterium]|nr:DUF4286 family protein [Chitinophagales bacterium]
MILYNITFHVELGVVADFKEFLIQEHLPFVTDSSHVLEHKLFKLLNVDESEAMTWTMQYYLEDMGTYNQHIAVIDTKLKKEIYERYGEQVLHFCSILEKI